MSPTDSPDRKATLEKIVTVFIVSALVTTYCLHFTAVSRYAVDIPEMDEWSAFLRSPTFLTNGPTLKQLLSRHNEHYILVTTLETVLLFHINRWDIATQQSLNFLLFGLLIALILHTGKRLRPEAPLWALSAFALFLLSPLGFRNHSWAMQSHVNFVLIFIILAVLALFSERQRGHVLLLGWIAMTLACFSQAAGVAASLVMILLYLCFKAARIRAIDERRRRIREMIQGLLMLFGSTMVFGMWFFDFRSSLDAKPIAYPWTKEFCRFLLESVSFGFGFETLPVGFGVFVLLLVVTPLVGTLLRFWEKLPAAFWAVGALLLSFLAILAAIAAGRGAGNVEGTHSKFFQFAVVLLPFTFLAWHWFIERSTRLTVIVGLMLWSIPAVGFADDLSFDVYRQTHKKRRVLERSVMRYYHGVGPVPSPPGMPPDRPIERYLSNAQRMGVSFALRLGLPLRKVSRGGELVGFGRQLRPIGRLEGIEEDGTVRGWAVSPKYPHRPVRVLVTIAGYPDRGRKVAEAVAELPRLDVKSTLGFPGDHGFRVRIPSNAIKPGVSLQAWVVDPQDHSEHLLPDYGNSSPLETWIDRPVGFLNGVDAGGGVVGWALDPDFPYKPLTVRIYLDGAGHGKGGILVGGSTAGLPRLDVEKVSAKNGDHGFRITLPSSTRDGNEHKIYGFARDAQGRPFALNHSGFEFRARHP